jgi:hypothetical protein
VLVHCGQGLEIESPGDLVEGWGIAIFFHEAADEVDHLFLPACNGHACHSSEERAKYGEEIFAKPIWVPNLKLSSSGVPKAKYRRRKIKAISCQHTLFDEMVSLQAGMNPALRRGNDRENPDC